MRYPYVLRPCVFPDLAASAAQTYVSNMSARHYAKNMVMAFNPGGSGRVSYTKHSDIFGLKNLLEDS